MVAQAIIQITLIHILCLGSPSSSKLNKEVLCHHRRLAQMSQWLKLGKATGRMKAIEVSASGIVGSQKRKPSETWERTLLACYFSATSIFRETGHARSVRSQVSAHHREGADRESAEPFHFHWHGKELKASVWELLKAAQMLDDWNTRAE